jgi:hypothetical protein
MVLKPFDTNRTSKYKQLDKLMLQLYKCSFEDFCNNFFQLVYERGLVDGYRVGKKDGRRAAKGIKQEPKKTGRPIRFEFTDIMECEVSKARASGKTIEQAVEDFLATMCAGIIEVDPAEIADAKTEMFPTTKEAVAIYKRAHAKVPYQTEIDKAVYIRNLVNESVKKSEN